MHVAEDVDVEGSGGWLPRTWHRLRLITQLENYLKYFVGVVPQHHRCSRALRAGRCRYSPSSEEARVPLTLRASYTELEPGVSGVGECHVKVVHRLVPIVNLNKLQTGQNDVV